MKKMAGKRSRDEINIYIDIFLEIISIHGKEKETELIKVKVRIGSNEYISYVQMSNKKESKNFKVLREM